MSDNNLNTASEIKHIAFIMDGNGRWAQKRGLEREIGHKFGAEAMKRVIRRCCELGIYSSTFYAFSTENWKRPEKEVKALMKLLGQYLNDLKKDLDKYDVRYRFIGDMSALSDDLQKGIKEIEGLSENKKYTVNIALNYGSRSELVYAYNQLARSGKKDITEKDISEVLYTSASPELDFLVRTGGEKRLSNFLLWQAAYAELYFCDILWPDMDTDAVDAAVDEFHKRKRRFGGL